MCLIGCAHSCLYGRKLPNVPSRTSLHVELPHARAYTACTACVHMYRSLPHVRACTACIDIDRRMNYNSPLSLEQYRPSSIAITCHHYWVCVEVIWPIVAGTVIIAPSGGHRDVAMHSHLNRIEWLWTCIAVSICMVYSAFRRKITPCYITNISSV